MNSFPTTYGLVNLIDYKVKLRFAAQEIFALCQGINDRYYLMEVFYRTTYQEEGKRLDLPDVVLIRDLHRLASILNKKKDLIWFSSKTTLALSLPVDLLFLMRQQITDPCHDPFLLMALVKIDKALNALPFQDLLQLQTPVAKVIEKRIKQQNQRSGKRILSL